METMARAAKYIHHLPQLAGGLFLTDGGLETTLIFHEGFELPSFAAFVLLDDARGQKALRGYFERYIQMALAARTGFILESPTWRANPDWGAKIGYDLDALARANHAAIELMFELRDRYETASSPIAVSGCIGPRGDGYDAKTAMDAGDAEAYHAFQIDVLRDAGADFVSAITMTSSAEALGVARAARLANMPCVISFTLETDGKLPTGEGRAAAIAAVDAGSGAWPAYYMINCAHPTHFDHVLQTQERWTDRLRGVRANASRLSHAELDNAPELDIGNPFELGAQYAALLRRLPRINVLGGCCGTDHRHVECISGACRRAA
jgi:S-methylmethionine-dependent homocysteine/selenocysteine methylase